MKDDEIEKIVNGYHDPEAPMSRADLRCAILAGMELGLHRGADVHSQSNRQAIEEAKREENEACADHLLRIGHQYRRGDGVELCHNTADAYFAAARSISARMKP